jgi:hypothetical protein
MKCINNYEQLEAADPETLKFHSTFKAIARMLIKYLPFSQIDEEKYAARLVGNSLIIYKIIKEWQENDTRTHRKNVLTKPLLIGLFTYAFDSDFREVFNFMFWRLLQLQNEFFIPPAHKDPSTWTNDEGKRSAQGAKVPHEVIVRRTSQSIVLTGALPPRLYWIEVGGIYYATNTNFPVWFGDGWAYQVIATWETEEEFRKASVLGDLL